MHLNGAVACLVTLAIGVAATRPPVSPASASLSSTTSSSSGSVPTGPFVSLSTRTSSSRALQTVSVTDLAVPTGPTLSLSTRTSSSRARQSSSASSSLTLSISSSGRASSRASGTPLSLSTPGTVVTSVLLNTAIPVKQSIASPSGSPNAAPTEGPYLVPAVHWDFDTHKVENLAPSNSCGLYYASSGVANPYTEHRFASVDTTFQHQAVVLDHSSHIKNVRCTTRGIIISFVSYESFTFAQGSWSQLDTFIIATFTESCLGTYKDQRSFFLTGRESIFFHEKTNTITCGIRKTLALVEALLDVDLKWGIYQPPGGGSGGSLPGSSQGGSSGGSRPYSSLSPGAQPSSTRVSSGAGAGSGSGSATSTGTGSSGRPTSTQDSLADTGEFCGDDADFDFGDDNLPRADCGAPDFDAQLDRAAGYLDFSEKEYVDSLGKYIPDVHFEGEELDPDEIVLKKRMVLQKRGLWSALKRVASKVAKIATAPLTIVAQAVTKIPVIGKIIQDKATLNPKVTGRVPINLGPQQNAQSPWGPAALIWSKSGSTTRTTSDVALYCVNCGIKGQITLTGTAKFNVLKGLAGLEEFQAGVGANIAAGINLGIYAAAQFKDTKKKSIINQAIPKLGLSVRGLFAAGVFVAVDAVADIHIRAEGEALLGATMKIEDFEAKLNLLSQTEATGSSITGFNPTFEKRFEARGRIDATTKLSLPISFNVGVQIIPIGFKRSLALVEQPSLNGRITVAASTPNAETTSNTCPNGVEYIATLENDVLFDFFGEKTFKIDRTRSVDIVPLTCKKFGGNSAKFMRRQQEEDDDIPGGGSIELLQDDPLPTFAINPSDRSIYNDDPVDDYLDNPNGPEFQKDAAASAQLASAASDNDGYSYSVIREIHNTFILSPDNNGNIYVVPPSKPEEKENRDSWYLFTRFKGTFVGDDQLRVLHYYTDEMNTYGASRLRLGPEDALPANADFIGLTLNSELGSLVAATSQDNGPTFGLALCHFTNGADSQIFLIKEESSITKLASPLLRYTVTGGIVRSCDPLALVAETQYVPNENEELDPDENRAEPNGYDPAEEDGSGSSGGDDE